MLTALSAGLLAQVTIGGLFWLAIVFFIIALVAWAMGAGGIAGMSAGIGRTVFFVALVIAVILFIVNFAMPRAGV